MLSLQTGSCKRGNLHKWINGRPSGDTMWRSLLYSALLKKPGEIANQIQLHDSQSCHSVLSLMRLKPMVLWSHWFTEVGENLWWSCRTDCERRRHNKRRNRVPRFRPHSGHNNLGIQSRGFRSRGVRRSCSTLICLPVNLRFTNSIFLHANMR